MNEDELNAKEKAWKQYRADVYARYLSSLTAEQKILLNEYQRSAQELKRLLTWRKHKPNIQKRIPKVVPWPPNYDYEK